MNRINRFLAASCVLAASLLAQQSPVTVVNTVADLLAYDPQGVATNRLVMLSGYYAANDGGEGEFRHSVYPYTTNYGTVFPAYGYVAGAGPVWLRQTRNSDQFNVKWFGAVGNGTTDDTTAIQAALTAGSGKTVYVPFGTYLITPNTTGLDVPANTMVDLGGATIKLGTMTGYYSANNLGIRIATTNVVVKNGTVRGDQTKIGLEATSFTISQSGTTVTCDFAAPHGIVANRRYIIQLDALTSCEPRYNYASTTAGAHAYDTLTIVDGDTVSWISPTSQTIGATAETGNIWFYNAGTGVYVSATGFVTLQDLVVEGWPDDGINVGHSQCTNIVVDRVISRNNYRNGISIVGVEKMTVSNSKFYGHQTLAPMSGIDCEPNSGTTHWNHDISFINSDFYQNGGIHGTGRGIYAQKGSSSVGSYNFKVTGCTFRDQTGNGMSVSTLTQVLIDNSIFTGNSTYGAYVANSSGLKVSDSAFSTNTLDGIYVECVEHSEFNGLTLSHNGRRGLNTTATTHVNTGGFNTLQNCDISYNESEGVYLYYEPSWTVTGNKIIRNGLTGLHLEGVENAVVTGNTFLGNVDNGGSYPQLYILGGFSTHQIVSDNVMKLSDRWAYGTATAGGASSITLTSPASNVDDWYNGYYVYILSGTGSGQTNTVADYNGSTRVATMDNAWGTPPDNTSVYEVRNPSGNSAQYGINLLNSNVKNITLSNNKTYRSGRTADVYDGGATDIFRINDDGSIVSPAASTVPTTGANKAAVYAATDSDTVTRIALKNSDGTTNTFQTMGVTTLSVTTSAAFPTVTVTNNIVYKGAASPTTDAAGETDFDTDAWAASHGAIQVYDGTANTFLLGVQASDTPSNGEVPTYNTGGTITWEAASGGTSPETNLFTTVGTNLWTKPANAKVVYVLCIAGGGGGASGRKGASGASRFGGGGGGGGGVSFATFDANSLADYVAVTVGGGGTGGASKTADNSNGSNGALGTNTTFGTYVRALAGTSAASGGTDAAGSSGNGGNGMFTGGSGASGTSASPSAPTSPAYAAAGGGGGAGMIADDIAKTGGTAGQVYAWVNTPATHGANGEASSTYMAGGGGGGGNSSSTGNAEAGGNGGNWGGGGGGGGASQNSVGDSGKGGDGAQGVCVVITFF